MSQNITIKDVEKRVANGEKIGVVKVNIRHEDGTHEGIWACFATPEDKKTYDADTHHHLITVYFMNNALIGGPSWGMKVQVKTCGDERPTISVDDLIKQCVTQCESGNYPDKELI